MINRMGIRKTLSCVAWVLAMPLIVSQTVAWADPGTPMEEGDKIQHFFVEEGDKIHFFGDKDVAKRNAVVVRKFNARMAQVVAEAKEPGFTTVDWDPLVELVDVEQFERVGPFMDAMNWEEYAEYLTQWAISVTHAGWGHSRLFGLYAMPALVIQNVEERTGMGDESGVVHSLTKFEFTDTGKISRIEVYMQRKPD